MKHEQEIAMKLLKLYGTKTLMFCMGVLGTVLLISLLTQAVILAFLALSFIAVASGLTYLYVRKPDAENSNTNTESL